MNLTDTSCIPDHDLTPGNYTMWVRAFNDAGASDWSQPSSFRVDGAAVSITESSGLEQGRPTLIWTASESATAYEVWINHRSEGKVVHEKDVIANTWTASRDLAAGPYRAWVRPLYGKTAGRWSSVYEFTIAPRVPPLAAPRVSVSLGTQPSVGWSPVNHATRYEIWISRIGEGRVIHRTDLMTIEFRVADSPASGSYRVWVRAISQQSTGRWSLPATFTVAH